MAHNARQIKFQRHPANRETGQRAGGRHKAALARLHSARVAQSRRRASLPRAGGRQRPLQGHASFDVEIQSVGLDPDWDLLEATQESLREHMAITTAAQASERRFREEVAAALRKVNIKPAIVAIDFLAFDHFPAFLTFF